jgi:hypothetical protein
LAGERDLAKLLAGIEATLHPARFAFTRTDSRELSKDGFALIAEGEGVALVAESPTGEWARISLGVHSSLEAVGLTAALTTALANAGISANVIAGLHHDHFLVPWERRQEALAVLASLGQRS